MQRALRWAEITGLSVVGVLLGVTAADAQRSSPMTKEEIKAAGHPNALCNDGTPPILYYQPGSGDDRNKWLIYFEGGAGCATDAACLDRAEANHDLVSSHSPNLPPAVTPDGIISTLPSVNPDFAGYNHVYLHYCSSDAYAGDAERKIGSATWQFRGKEIVAAMLDQLSASRDAARPSLKDATDVVVAGSSAGAMGVHNNLDAIAERLAPAKVVGIADSGWMPYGIKPFAPGSFDVRPDAPAAMAFYNAKPDQSCVDANPDMPGACLNENFALKYITAPMFVFADQRDPSLLAVLGMLNPPRSVAETDYAYNYARQVRESLAAVAPAYFVADYGRHTVLLGRQYATVTAAGQTLGTILHNWYFGTGGPVVALAPAPGAPGTTR
jgi:Pectinacetylesterase